MIIDAHTHVWPDKIAEIALGGNRVEGLEARGDGTVGGLTQRHGRQRRPGQLLPGDRQRGPARRLGQPVRRRSGGRDATCRSARCTSSLSVEENLASLQRHGVRAVKIHPLFQKYALDDPRLWEIFEAFGSDYRRDHARGGGR